jgi:hypothetical protein
MVMARYIDCYGDVVLYRYTAALKPLTERVAIAEFMREIGLRCTGINGVCLTIII